MVKIYTQSNWMLKVFGNEHPPVHVHVTHPDGDALIYLDGRVLNNGVPAKAIRDAVAWIEVHYDLILAEWARNNNPRR